MSLNQLSSRELESHCLAGLIKHPDILPEIDNFVSDDCFYCGETSEHKIIFSITKKLILDNKKFDNVLIAQKISELNINLGDLSPFDYLEAITQFDINKEACIENFKELAKLKFLRDKINELDKAKKYIISNRSKPVIELISEVDKIQNQVTNTIFNNEKEFHNIYEDLENLVEEIADNPPNESNFWYGPFQTINRIYGSLHRPGNITMVAARTSIGKSNLSLFYNTYICEKYDIPCLHLDNGELLLREFQIRAMCMMTKGKIPYHAIENGYWRDKPEWLKIGREVWPRIKKLKFHFKQIASLRPEETISVIRRYSYQEVGRGNPFFVDLDYLKSFNTSDINVQDWKELGNYIQDIKSFITGELEIPFWCSIQRNRKGIVKNHSAEQIDDSDDSIGLSDRITQQTSQTFIMRNKTLDELAKESNQFGNMVFKNVKKRHLGKDYFDAINPVEYEKGKYKENYINLNQDSFYFEDRGDLKTMVEALKEKYETQPDNDNDNDNGMGLI